MPRYDLLAVDLDGTLLDSSRQIPPANREALRQATGAGVKLAVVTGRRFPAARSLLEGLELDFWLVLNGGALTKRDLNGEIVDRRLLPLDLGRQILAAAARHGMEPVVHDGPEGEGFLIAGVPTGAHRALAVYLERSHPAPRYVSSLEEALERDPVEIMFADTPERVRGCEARLTEQFGARVSLARTEYPRRELALLDVLAAGASKGRSVRYIAESERIPTDRIMAIGDNWNDVEMLEAAGLAVLMGNSDAELQARGFALTATNDEAGVARAVYDYLL